MLSLKMTIGYGHFTNPSPNHPLVTVSPTNYTINNMRPLRLFILKFVGCVFSLVRPPNSFTETISISLITAGKRKVWYEYAIICQLRLSLSDSPVHQFLRQLILHNFLFEKALRLFWFCAVSRPGSTNFSAQVQMKISQNVAPAGRVMNVWIIYECLSAWAGMVL